MNHAFVINTLNQLEARGMRTQHDVVWQKAAGHTITDIDGKEYIDFTSGVMIANAGFDCEPIKQAIIDALQAGILTSYMFPNQIKANLLQALAECIPENYKIALFSTGAETTEAAIKIARTWSAKHKPHSKNIIVSYDNAFHGRTLGALCLTGLDKLKHYFPSTVSDSMNCRVPFPDSFYGSEITFSGFLAALQKQRVTANDISAVIIECYQGVVGCMAPKAYMQQLSAWCKEHHILLIVDEIQSGFCRTGKWWAYQHYAIEPDMILAGKGISSSLPLSAVIAKADVIDVCDPGTLNTTHSSNIICCAAANANIRYLKENKLAERTKKLGMLFATLLQQIQADFPDKIRAVFSIGLMAALHIGNASTRTPNPEFAKKLASICIERGLMMYKPGGPEGSTIKLAPPLVITEAALIQGCNIIRDHLRGE